MFSDKPTTILIGIAIISGAIGFVQVGLAETATIQGKSQFITEISTIHQISKGDGDLTIVDLSTLGTNKAVILTDLIVGNATSSDMSLTLKSGSTVKTGQIVVPANSSFSHQFATGIRFPGGTPVVATVGSPSNTDQLSLTISGFEAM